MKKKIQHILAKARSNIQQLQPYSSARLHASAEELENSILLNANENPYAPPTLPGYPDTRRYNYYPEPQPQSLVHALAELYGVGCKQILVGRGSDEGIDLLIRAFCGEQDRIAICSPTFGMYRSYAEIQSCEVLDLPLQILADGADPATSKLQLCWTQVPLAALQQRLKAPHPPQLLFIPSPLAPSGSLIPREDLQELLNLCAVCNVLLVIDEAYAEFAQILEPVDYQSLIPRLEEYPNLVILRTLSKAYSLAGERVGSLIAAPELIKLLRPIQSPYPIPSSISDYASKLLQNPEARADMRRHIEELCCEQQHLFAFLQTLPYIERIFYSATNFILLQIFPQQCEHFLQHCRAQGLTLRDFRRTLQGAVRISAGNMEQMQKLRNALQNFP